MFHSPQHAGSEAGNLPNNLIRLQVDPDPATLQTLTCMGFNQDSAANALRQCGNKQARAIEMLVSWGPSARASTPPTSTVDAEPGSSNRGTSTVTASVEGDASRQMATAAALLAQALQSDPAGQHMPTPCFWDLTVRLAEQRACIDHCHV